MNDSLSNSRDTLIQLIMPLTYEQLNWKPEKSKWSVAQVVLHVAEAEARFLKLVETAVQENKVGTAAKVDFSNMKDRTVKMVAPIEPSKDEMSLDVCIEALNESRTNTLQVLLHTPELQKYVLHHHRYGDMTADQIFELMVEHELRHVEQIKELVKEMPK